MTGLDFAQLRRTLPHGPGMVLLDRVEELLPGESLRAVKTIAGIEPCYADLAAGSGIEAYAYPEPLLLESFGQAAAVLWLHSGPGRRSDHVLMFVAARDCRFTGRAYPGDVVHHEVVLDHRSDGVAFVSGHSRVGSRRVASYGSLCAVIRPRSALAAPAGSAGSTVHHDPEGALGHG